MEHDIFIEKYNSNQISVNVDRNKAGLMYQNPGLMPKRYRNKQALLRTMGFGGILLGIALFFFTNWWIAAAVILVSFFSFPNVQKSSARGVLLAALEDENVYEVALNSRVIIIKENS